MFRLSVSHARFRFALLVLLMLGFVASGAEAPPDAAASGSELERLRTLAERDTAAFEQIAFWDTGAPSNPWNELAIIEAVKRREVAQR